MPSGFVPLPTQLVPISRQLHSLFHLSMAACTYPQQQASFCVSNNPAVHAPVAFVFLPNEHGSISPVKLTLNLPLRDDLSRLSEALVMKIALHVFGFPVAITVWCEPGVNASDLLASPESQFTATRIPVTEVVRTLLQHPAKAPKELKVKLSKPRRDPDKPLRNHDCRRIFTHGMFHDLSAPKHAWNLLVFVRAALHYRGHEAMTAAKQKEINKGTISVTSMKQVVEFVSEAASAHGIAFPDLSLVVSSFSKYEDAGECCRNVFQGCAVRGGDSLARAVFEHAKQCIPESEPARELSEEAAAAESEFFKETCKRQRKIENTMMEAKPCQSCIDHAS